MKKKQTSVVNRITEYTETFDRLSNARAEKGLKKLQTPMEYLIETMTDPKTDPETRLEIAKQLLPFSASKAPSVSVEHALQIQAHTGPVADANEALAEFLSGLETKEEPKL